MPIILHKKEFDTQPLKTNLEVSSFNGLFYDDKFNNNILQQSTYQYSNSLLLKSETTDSEKPVLQNTRKRCFCFFY